MALVIRPLAANSEPPWELLLLADPSRRQVAAHLEHGRCYLAFLEDELVGAFVLAQTAGRTWEIMNIAIAEAHQGRGWGKQLVRAAIDAAREMGAAVVEVGTGNSSLSQLALYQKCGFRIVGVERDFFTERYDQAIFENGIRCTDMIRLRLSLEA